MARMVCEWCVGGPDLVMGKRQGRNMTEVDPVCNKRFTLYLNTELSIVIKTLFHNNYLN